MGFRKVFGRQTADKCFRQLTVGQAFEVAADLVDEAEPDLVRHHLIIEDPFLGFRNCHGFGEKSVHLDHFDTAAPHLLHEVEMVALRGVDPDHIVVQQLVAIARCQTLMRTPRRANHHLAQLAHLGVHTEGCALGIRHVDLPCLKL